MASLYARGITYTPSPEVEATGDLTEVAPTLEVVSSDTARHTGDALAIPSSLCDITHKAGHLACDLIVKGTHVASWVAEQRHLPAEERFRVRNVPKTVLGLGQTLVQKALE